MINEFDRASETIAAGFFHVRCPHCRQDLDVSADESPADVRCPHCGRSFGMLGDQPVTGSGPNTHQAVQQRQTGPTCLIVLAVLGLLALFVGIVALVGLLVALRMKSEPLMPAPVAVETWEPEPYLAPPEPVIAPRPLPPREFSPPAFEPVATVAAREEAALKAKFPTARKLADAAYAADWSPDGREIVYGRRSGGIVVMDLESEQQQVLCDEGKDPRWSPGDGKYIAFVQGSSRDETVWIVEAAGGASRQVADGGYPNWSADGRRITYRAFDLRSTVKSVAVEDPDAEPQIVYDQGPVSFYPAVSPVGTRVAVQRGAEMAVINMEDPAQPADELTFPIPDWRGYLPAWSRDGRRLSFGTFGQDEGRGLWTVDFGLPQPVPELMLEGQFTLGLWSPDGKRMLLDHRTRVDWNIWIVDLDGPTE